MNIIARVLIRETVALDYKGRDKMMIEARCRASGFEDGEAKNSGSLQEIENARKWISS